MTLLTHYTCPHGASGIEADGLIRPRLQMVFRGEDVRVIWLTDTPGLGRGAYGLTSIMLACDRMERSFQVPAEDCVPFLEWLGRFDKATRRWALLVLVAGQARPRTWWISEKPIPIQTPSASGAEPATTA